MTGQSLLRRTPASGAALDGKVRNHLGEQLRAIYGAGADERPPQALLALVEQLDTAVATARRDDAKRFRRELIEALPHVRAFAHSLVANEARTDDLVQETVLKAWQNQHRFAVGTNLKAWLFTITRNHFYGEIRKYKRETEDVDGIAAARMIALPNQEHVVILEKVEVEMRKMPAPMREALILVGAQEMTYEDAADVMRCAIGTVKSRVSRGRAALADAIN